MTTKSQENAKALQKLKGDYRSNLPAELSCIAGEWTKICSKGWLTEVARRIHAKCHQLSGSAHTFGFPEVGVRARAVESKLNFVFDEKVAPDVRRLEELDTAIRELLDCGASDAGGQDQMSSGSTGEAPPGGSAGDTSAMALEPGNHRVQPLSSLPIFIVEDDEPLTDYIVMELAIRGYDARAVYHLSDLDKEMRSSGRQPGAIVMDVAFPGATTGGIDLINKFREDQILKAPVIFISGNDSFATRLEIVRAGGDAFFVKPFEMNLLIEKLESLVGIKDPDPLRILILDDDPLITEVICIILEESGLRACATNDPREVVERVLDFNPDLVILDMYMPEINGMEIAQVLRQHDSCADMPLLFLSSESDPKIMAQALNIGVDDFLIKPVDRDYLVSAVANRAQRARGLESRMYRDSLTHLLVHDEIKNQLANLLNTVQRKSSGLCYALLDLDHFKRVNDTHGHLTGDLVLKAMASLLRRSFRRSDVLGRYGGEEFVVILPDTSIVDAAAVLDKVRIEFSRIGHRSEVSGEEFFVTLSAGLSDFPQFREVEELQASADKALYDAKAGGRNRICIAKG